MKQQQQYLLPITRYLPFFCSGQIDSLIDMLSKCRKETNQAF